MSDRSDGPDTGPVEERAGRPDRPPVPRSLPADDPGVLDGRHRTEQVPFPLPPLPPQDVPRPAPETGPLDLGGYPPRVPGPVRRPDTARQDAAPEDDATARPDPDGTTGSAPDGR
ncbi:MAG: hypothetical protein JWP68_1163 [Modestobacter sp.]|nr:hypothetical protein [Modestobacter sp.]